jgi:hypothetical protein
MSARRRVCHPKAYQSCYVRATSIKRSEITRRAETMLPRDPDKLFEAMQDYLGHDCDLRWCRHPSIVHDSAQPKKHRRDQLRITHLHVDIFIAARRLPT